MADNWQITFGLADTIRPFIQLNLSVKNSEQTDFLYTYSTILHYIFCDLKLSIDGTQSKVLLKTWTRHSHWQITGR